VEVVEVVVVVVAAAAAPAVWTPPTRQRSCDPSGAKPTPPTRSGASELTSPYDGATLVTCSAPPGV
jgi:hypothetical protein